MSRKITIFNTSDQRTTELETNATHYKDIKAQVNPNKDYKAIIQSTKQTLDLGDALLPEGDFVIFLFPEKVKSGLDEDDYSDQTPADVIRAIVDLDDAQTQRHLDLMAKANDILRALQNGGTPAAKPTSEFASEAAKLAEEFKIPTSYKKSSGW